MINYLDLARRLKGKSLGAQERAGILTLEEADALMPWAYRRSNPNGRFFHDDWGIRGLPLSIQPWTKIRRMDTWYRLPLPFKLIWSKGDVRPSWEPWQEGYPMSSIIQLRDAPPGARAPREFLTYHPVLALGQSALFAAEIDGEWMPAYYTTSKKVFGRRLHINGICKFDVTLGDFGCQFPDASSTYKEI